MGEPRRVVLSFPSVQSAPKQQLTELEQQVGDILDKYGYEGLGAQVAVDLADDLRATGAFPSEIRNALAKFVKPI